MLVLNLYLFYFLQYDVQFIGYLKNVCDVKIGALYNALNAHKCPPDTAFEICDQWECIKQKKTLYKAVSNERVLWILCDCWTIKIVR